jgi:hypothetical protein
MPAISGLRDKINNNAQQLNANIFQSNPISTLIINPVAQGWGDVNPLDAKAVSLSAGKVLLENIPGLRLEPIILKNDPSGPISLYQRGSQNEYIILVNIKGLYWAQLAYQFSHELMHILSNYIATPGDANQWFEEALCEAASIHAIQRMSVVWRTNPPYPNFKSYSSSLGDYYKNLLAEQHRYLKPGETLANWYKREQQSLRANHAQRPKNELVGTKIYAFFNASPDRWRSVRYLNIGNANKQISLEQYLNDWRTSLPDDLKYVAKTISGWFGYD